MIVCALLHFMKFYLRVNEIEAVVYIQGFNHNIRNETTIETNLMYIQIYSSIAFYLPFVYFFFHLSGLYCISVQKFLLKGESIELVRFTRRLYTENLRMKVFYI